MKYADNFFLSNRRELVTQEILLMNTSSETWPSTTQLSLVQDDTRSDVIIPFVVSIGQVPARAQVRIQLSIDARKSEIEHHVVVYELCYEETETPGEAGLNSVRDCMHRIGLPITFHFKIADFLNKNKDSTNHKNLV